MIQCDVPRRAENAFYIILEQIEKLFRIYKIMKVKHKVFFKNSTLFFCISFFFFCSFSFFNLCTDYILYSLAWSINGLSRKIFKMKFDGKLLLLLLIFFTSFSYDFLWILSFRSASWVFLVDIENSAFVIENFPLWDLLLLTIYILF